MIHFVLSGRARKMSGRKPPFLRNLRRVRKGEVRQRRENERKERRKSVRERERERRAAAVS